MGLGLACTTLVGQALGARNPDDAHRWAWDVGKVAVVLLTVLGMPMWIAPDLISSIFIHDEATRELARWPMRITGLTMPIEALGFSFMHGLLGAGDAKRVMVVSVGVQWLLFLPAAFLIGPVLGYGLLAIWVMQGIGRTLQSAIFVASWQGRSWQKREI
jgi:Na+-driven multidrug efflux pump